MEHGASARRRPVVGCSVVIDPKHDSCTKRAGAGFTKELGVAGSLACRRAAIMPHTGDDRSTIRTGQL
jgi:hypothetical protein